MALALIGAILTIVLALLFRDEFEGPWFKFCFGVMISSGVLALLRRPYFQIAATLANAFFVLLVFERLGSNNAFSRMDFGILVVLLPPAIVSVVTYAGIGQISRYRMWQANNPQQQSLN